MIDTHVHVLWPQRHPYPDGPGYKPSHEVGDPDALLAMMAAHGTTHALLVQPSSYAFDNQPIIDTIALHPGRFKGIGGFAPDATREELRAARAQGIVGVRLNLYSFDPALFQNAAITTFLAHCRDEDLFVELFAPARFWPQIGPVLRTSGVRLIIEHLGWPDVALGTGQEGFTAMLALADLPDVCIKLTCGFRLTQAGPPYEDLAPYARAIVGAFGIERCLWGSDWPFMGPDTRITVAQELASLTTWVPDAAQRQAVLVDNPRRIFGFA